MSILKPVVFVDIVGLTSYVEFYVSGSLVKRYTYADATKSIHIQEFFGPSIGLTQELANTNFSGIAAWIQAMIAAGFPPSELFTIFTDQFPGRQMNTTANFNESYVETDTDFTAKLSWPTVFGPGQPLPWSSAVTYARDEGVIGSDGIFYESAKNGNIGRDPTLSGKFWKNNEPAPAPAQVKIVYTKATKMATVFTVTDITLTGMQFKILYSYFLRVLDRVNVG